MFTVLEGDLGSITSVLIMVDNIGNTEVDQQDMMVLFNVSSTAESMYHIASWSEI